MKILSATVFLSLGLAIGSAISALAGSMTAPRHAATDDGTPVGLQQATAAHTDRVLAMQASSVEVGGSR